MRLKNCIHIIVNFQSKCTSEWFRSELMPAASRTCFGTAAVIDDDDDDDDGPALELIGLVCMTISEMLLRIGMAAVSNDPSDPKNDIHDAAYK